MEELPIAENANSVIDTHAATGDVLETFERIDEAADVQQSDFNSSASLLVARAKRNAVASTSTEHPAKCMKADTTDARTDPPDQQSPLNILNALNDDCFVEILERLPADDLYAVACVCKRLRPMAVKRFHSIYKDKEFYFDRVKHAENEPRTASLFVNYLRIFNPTRVERPLPLNHNIALRAMAKYCTNLEELNTRFASKATIAAIWPFLPRFRKLEIATSNFLSSCDDIDWLVEDLTIYIYYAEHRIPNVNMPKLAKLQLRYFEPNHGPMVFEFLARNTHVKELCFHGTFSWAQWCSLSQCAPNVEHLALFNCRIADKGNQVPGTLTCLKEFELKNNYDVFKYFMQFIHGAPLERFTLYGEEAYLADDPEDYNIDSICQLTAITSLHLGQSKFGSAAMCISDDEYMQLMHSLSNLRELHIDEARITFSSIRRILTSEANKLTRLDIGLHWNKKVDFEPAVLDDISAIIASRPGLQVRVEVRRRCLKVRSSAWRAHTKWLFVRNGLRYGHIHGVNTSDDDDNNNDDTPGSDVSDIAEPDEDYY